MRARRSVRGVRSRSATRASGGRAERRVQARNQLVARTSRERGRPALRGHAEGEHAHRALRRVEIAVRGPIDAAHHGADGARARAREVLAERVVVDRRDHHEGGIRKEVRVARGVERAGLPTDHAAAMEVLDRGVRDLCDEGRPPRARGREPRGLLHGLGVAAHHETPTVLHDERGDERGHRGPGPSTPRNPMAPREEPGY